MPEIFPSQVVQNCLPELLVRDFSQAVCPSCRQTIVKVLKNELIKIIINRKKTTK